MVEGSQPFRKDLESAARVYSSLVSRGQEFILTFIPKTLCELRSWFKTKSAVPVVFDKALSYQTTLIKTVKV